MFSLLLLLTATAVFAGIVRKSLKTQGPSSTDESYLTLTEPGRAISILSAGDDGGGLRLAGMADGSGGYVSPDDPRKMILLINHEVSYFAGIQRKHGTTGAFVSRFVVDRRTLRVESGAEFNQSPESLHLANNVTSRRAMSRFCSGNLAAESALFDRQTGLVSVYHMWFFF